MSMSSAPERAPSFTFPDLAPAEVPAAGGEPPHPTIAAGDQPFLPILAAATTGAKSFSPPASAAGSASHLEPPPFPQRLLSQALQHLAGTASGAGPAAAAGLPALPRLGAAPAAGIGDGRLLPEAPFRAASLDAAAALLQLPQQPGSLDAGSVAAGSRPGGNRQQRSRHPSPSPEQQLRRQRQELPPLPSTGHQENTQPAAKRAKTSDQGPIMESMLQLFQQAYPPQQVQQQAGSRPQQQQQQQQSQQRQRQQHPQQSLQQQQQQLSALPQQPSPLDWQSALLAAAVASAAAQRPLSPPASPRSLATAGGSAAAACPAADLLGNSIFGSRNLGMPPPSAQPSADGNAAAADALAAALAGTPGSDALQQQLLSLLQLMPGSSAHSPFSPHTPENSQPGKASPGQMHGGPVSNNTGVGNGHTRQQPGSAAGLPGTAAGAGPGPRAAATSPSPGPAALPPVPSDQHRHRQAVFEHSVGVVIHMLRQVQHQVAVHGAVGASQQRQMALMQQWALKVRGCIKQMQQQWRELVAVMQAAVSESSGSLRQQGELLEYLMAQSAANQQQQQGPQEQQQGGQAVAAPKLEPSEAAGEGQQPAFAANAQGQLRPHPAAGSALHEQMQALQEAKEQHAQQLGELSQTCKASVDEVQHLAQENASLRQQLNRLWNNQKEQQAQAEQLAGVAVHERQERQRLEASLAALQQHVQSLVERQAAARPDADRASAKL